MMTTEGIAYMALVGNGKAAARTPIPAPSWTAVHVCAWLAVTAPRGSGLNFVRVTLASRSRSRVSFQVQAAPRNIAEPRRNRAFVATIEPGAGTGEDSNPARSVENRHGRYR